VAIRSIQSKRCAKKPTES